MYVVCINVQRLVVVSYSLSILSLCARSVLNNLVCIHVTVSSWRIVRPFADIYQTLESQIALSASESTRHPTFAVRKITALGMFALFSKCPSSLTIVYIRVLDTSCNRIDRDAAVSG